MEFNEVIEKRQSTRKFSDKKLEKDKLLKILEAARIAPTAKNIQPIKIYVVEKDENLKLLDTATPCRYNAPQVLIVCGDKDQAFKKNNISKYEIDASIVATHIILAATSLGVDNIWIELFDNNKIKEIFNIPKNIEPVALIPLGYKSDDCPPSPMHNKRKPLDELVEYK